MAKADYTGCGMCYGDVLVEYSHDCEICGITTCDGCPCKCPPEHDYYVIIDFSRGRVMFLNDKPMSLKEAWAEMQRINETGGHAEVRHLTSLNLWRKA